jgi:hypothetical protein
MEKSVNLNSLFRASTRTRRVLFTASSVAATAFASVGCGESVDDALTGNGDEDAFTAIYEADEFQECSGCHAPGAPGRVAGVETTQNWSTRDTAYSSLQGNAAGLIGNFAGCNGVPFLGDSAQQSLLVAVFDEDVRANFELAAFPDCTADAISDETLKVGELPPSLLQGRRRRALRLAEP